jgi:4-amino-4-deoxy-L-arabinose transferase-like glycosyltransferase
MSVTVRRLIFAAIFVAAFGTYGLRAYRSGNLNNPPEAGDGPDYEAIAFNVWKGRGYGYYWSDPEYRAPYEGLARYRDLLTRQSTYYPTTYRPPALPYLLSAVYTVAGRNFAVWRILNCAIMAGAVTIAVAIAVHLAGLLAAPVALGLLLQSPRLTQYSQMFMTEGQATFLVSLLAFIWLTQRQRRWKLAGTAASGAALGALMAVRSIYVLWVPIALFAPTSDPKSEGRFGWRAKAVCLATCLLVIAPWWVRNIVVTKAFMPAGTQGPLNLPAGFGPQALKYDGMWRSIRDDEADALRAQNVDPYSVEFEVRLARTRSQIATAWMREHPADVLRLMILHVWQETKPRGHPFWDYLLPLGAVAAFVLRKSPGVGIVVLMVCANIVSVAMTWGAGGRFMTPVQPLLLALISALIAVGIRQTTSVLQRQRDRWSMA